jgi:hypothetical protein
MDATSRFDGVSWQRGALTEAELAALDSLSAINAKPGLRLGLGPATRAALRPVDARVQRAVPGMVPVRLVAFDKTAQSNWALPWHQDRVIAVAQRHDVSGYDNWTRKDGVWHCEPPLLQRMLFVRVHLDNCDRDGGAMEIAIGSHQAGKIDAGSAMAEAQRYPGHICQAQRGDVLMMDMLTLHRSLPASKPSARRVLRVDYAAVSLPAPLAWAK